METATGVPATTAVRAAMDAMEHLGMRRIVLATPYPEATNQLLTKFIEHYGFEVVHSAWLNVPFKELQDVPPAVVYRFALEAAAKAKDADGLYMPCPQWPVWDVVDVLERDLNKPVVCNTNASFFVAFSKLEIRDEITGFGRLLGSLAGL